MRRLFWLGLGAAAGYYAARRGEEAVGRAKERGLVGNVTLAAGTAQRVAATASRTAAVIGERARTLAAEQQPAPSPEPRPAPTPTPSPTRLPTPQPAPARTDAREARP